MRRSASDREAAFPNMRSGAVCCIIPTINAERVLPIAVLSLLLLLLAAVSPAFAGAAKALRIAAWNLEHLNDNETKGCLRRTQEDYDAIGRAVMELDAAVIAFQEVKNEAAARLSAGDLAYRDIDPARSGSRRPVPGPAGEPSRSSGDRFRHP